MKTLEGCLYPVVFATWTGFLLYLLISMRYVEFIRPEFGLLLAVAYFIAMGFMVAAMVHTKMERLEMDALFRALVLLVPVLYFIDMPHAMLGNQAFKKRFTGNGNEVLNRKVTSDSRTILHILLDPSFFKGQKVNVTGMILRDQQLKPHFGGRDTVVYRFLITCCAADALPLSIALDTDLADSFDADQWVEVDGIFDVKQIKGKSVHVILSPLIKAVKAPETPYLF